MIDAQESVFKITTQSENVFTVAAKCVSRALRPHTHALLTVLAATLPDTEIDEACIQPNGVPVGAAEVRTAMRIIGEILGKDHPATQRAMADLAAEFSR